MNAETTQYKRTLRGSIGAGIGSLFDGNGRSYFILEHKNSSAYHKAGESQKIIVDQIEIGRDASCQVQFDESFQTVSRKHAAIVREGDNWKLVHLSQTNCTLLNGRIIEKEWYLQNGDEIQLSAGGPKLGFIIPAGKQSLVSSIKMTERLELFRKQALAPYKTAIACLAVILVLSVAGLVSWNIVSERQHEQEMADLQEQTHKQAEEYLTAQEDIMTKNEEIKHKSDSLEKVLSRLNNELLRKKNVQYDLDAMSSDRINQVRESVYLIFLKEVTLVNQLGIRVTLTLDEVENSQSSLRYLFGSGTGFLLEDGTFVTAKHVVQPHLFIKPGDPLCEINSIVTNSGEINYVFQAISPTDRFEFTDKQVICDRTQERIFYSSADYETADRYKVSPVNGTDWAYVKVSKKGNIKMNAELSKNLKSGSKLAILGYPSGQFGDNIQSILGSCMIALDGITSEKVIWTTERNFEHGNSGGPVFAVDKNGEMTAVALVSAGVGETLGFLVPLSNISMF